MRRALSVSDWREYVKMFKFLVGLNAALFGLTALWYLWSWSSRPDLARTNILVINVISGVGLLLVTTNFFRYRRRLDAAAGIK